MPDDQPVLVLISVDPRDSHRANEAMRIALGIVSGENAVTVILTGQAVHLLDADTDDLVDGDDIAKFRAALRAVHVPFHVDRSAIPTDGDWNTEGHALVPVTETEIANLVRSSRRVLVF